MSSFGLNEKTILEITSALKQFPSIESASIFGSRAMGNFKKGSDIDIALMGDSVTDKVVQDFHAICEERLPVPYRFDVVGYHLLEELAIKEHIDRYGIQFYTKN